MLRLRRPRFLTSTASMALASTVAASPALAQSADSSPDSSYVAVVIGVSAYENMPEEVELDYARSEAATVAEAFQKGGHYDAVFLLTDRNARRADIAEVLREKAAQYIGPKDTLVVYFVGHGIGGDLGLPTLLAYDSTVQNGQEDGFEVEAFARDIATWTRAGTTLLVTDAIHKNQLDGIYFYGPAADQWPGITPGTMVLSASKASQPGKDGAFGPVFADAIYGAADANGDTRITAAELTSYLTDRLAGSGQTPMVAGSYPDDMVLVMGVTPGATAVSPKPIDEATLYGDAEVYSAKFTFRDGDQPTVQCRDKEIQICDTTCYVRQFKQGPCRIAALVDGKRVEGSVLAWWPGKYDCGLNANGDLGCVVPLPPTAGKK
ncbi:MAG: caspase family protein [Alphaproteobacteria bacterium]|nr:caspase family protein [Alphaproteobacteria bacterium]